MNRRVNRRALVLGASALGVAALAGGSWLVRDRRAKEEAAATAAEAQRLAAAPPAHDPLVRASSPVLGPKDAPVTLVEFFDPSCESCRAFHPTLKKLRAEFPTQLRIVLRYATFHEGSDEAVRILEAARRQGIYEPVLDALLEMQPQWAVHGRPQMGVAWVAALEAGMDIVKGQAERKFPGTVALLNQDAADVKALAITGTPTFFLNGRRLRNLNFAGLTEEVRKAVAEAG